MSIFINRQEADVNKVINKLISKNVIDKSKNC